MPPAAVSGPTRPQGGVVAPEPSERLPLVPVRPGPSLWWVGAHGGSGESTMSGLVAGWAAAGHRWPVTGAGERVVLVARSSMGGLMAARTAARQWAAGGVPGVVLVGLVVVADAPGRLPRPLRQMSRLVGGGVPRTWHVPWVEAWRLGQAPDLAGAPRQVTDLVRDLEAVAEASPGTSGARS